MSEFQTKLHEAFQQAQTRAAARARELEQEARKVLETLGRSRPGRAQDPPGVGRQGLARAAQRAGDRVGEARQEAPGDRHPQRAQGGLDGFRFSSAAELTQSVGCRAETRAISIPCRRTLTHTSPARLLAARSGRLLASRSWRFCRGSPAGRGMTARSARIGIVSVCVGSPWRVRLWPFSACRLPSPETPSSRTRGR